MLSPPLPRVLIVDDDVDACEMLSELLRLSFSECVCAKSAAEAWKVMALQRFDLYVLDAWLPDLDGFQLCRQIRAIDSTTPILFYSGAAYDRDKQAGIAAGANAYLVKPDVEGLVETMAGLIAEARRELIKRSTANENLIERDGRSSFLALHAVRTGTYS